MNQMNQISTQSTQTQQTQDETILTVAELKEALPGHLKGYASQDLADKVNQYVGDPQFAEMLKENLVTYTGVLKEGRFKIADYISAVTYVSLKIMGFTNQDAYARTFPQRYQDLVARGADAKEISAYVAAYNKGKLVNLVLEQTLIPAWVYNQGTYQKAINRQAWLMENAKSEKVQAEAANSLLTHLKKPEKTQVELDIGYKDNSGMEELRDMMAGLAQRQKELIGQGMSTKDVAHQPLRQSQKDVDGEYKDVTPENQE